jgi:hypothetical protein
VTEAFILELLCRPGFLAGRGNRLALSLQHLNLTKNGHNLLRRKSHPGHLLSLFQSNTLVARFRNCRSGHSTNFVRLLISDGRRAPSQPNPKPSSELQLTLCQDNVARFQKAKLKSTSLEMYESMSEKELDAMTSVKRSKLPERTGDSWHIYGNSSRVRRKVSGRRRTPLRTLLETTLDL